MGCNNSKLEVDEISEFSKQKVIGILVVDDVKIMYDIILKTFKYNNYDIQIDYAQNGYKALEILSKNPNKYNVVFMDVKMSPIDGFETTKLIKKKTTYNSIILGISGMVDRDSIKKGKSSGMQDIFPKPITFKNLINKLNQYNFYFTQCVHGI